jgi:hypothetical protein
MPEPSVSLQEQLDAQRRKVDVDHFDITARELVRMAVSGEIIRAPEYQRKFRWNEVDESRLIESLLLGFPVPSVFVAANTDGTWELVDGLQRVSTLIHFTSDAQVVLKELNRQGPLRLEGLEKLSHFNGLTFSELPTPIQLHFQKRGIRVTALSDKSDPEVRFDTFERLNNGGITLSHQEVRACIYRGPFIKFTKKLVRESPKFKGMIKLQKRHQHDGTLEELVIKFFAYLRDRQNFKGDVKDFLNKYAEKANKSLDEAQDRELFNQVVHELLRLLGGQQFIRPGVSVTPRNQLEAVMVGAAEVLLSGDKIQMPPPNWMEDGELLAASSAGTNSKILLDRRIARARKLLSGVANGAPTNGEASSDDGGDQQRP